MYSLYVRNIGDNIQNLVIFFWGGGLQNMEFSREKIHISCHNEDTKKVHTLLTTITFALQKSAHLYARF